MEKKTTYQQLQPEDRIGIASMTQQGWSMRAMALMLGRSPSTNSRERARNAVGSTAYASHTVQVCSAGRRTTAPTPRRRA